MAPLRRTLLSLTVVLFATGGAAATELRPIHPDETSSQRNFTTPDTATASWLVTRIPGLDPATLRTVSLEAAEAFLRRATAAQATDLDLFSDPALQADRVAYYLPQDVLEGLDARCTAGLFAVSGTATDGKPFHMRAVVATNARIAFLYDREDEFRYEEGGSEVKITNSGRVFARAEGPGDISFTGYNGCGCIFVFCGCAEITRMTKLGDGKMTVRSSRSDRTRDLRPIRMK
jgi:hypothetical protein